MLVAHFRSVEETLLAISRIPANAGHSLHKGTPREAFIREFLEKHLSETVAVGTGEIIDCNSRPNPPATAQRHQYDIVIYRRDYPRLDLGGGITAFLVESVVATIEVKSRLDKDELQASTRAARACKQLTRNVVTSFTTGYQPPAILNYVVAYDGPAKMETVYGWTAPIHTALGITTTPLPQGEERFRQPSPSIDGVFVLGKGFMTFDNVPWSFMTSERRQQQPTHVWSTGEADAGSLLYLFLLLTGAVSGAAARWLNPMPYLRNFRIGPVGSGP